MDNNEQDKYMFKNIIAPFDPNISITLKRKVENDVVFRTIVSKKESENYKIDLHPQVLELLKIGYIKQRSKKWMESRTFKITASNVDTLLRNDGCKTKETLFKEKLGICSRFKGNIYTEHGILYEPIGIHRYQMLTRKIGLKFGLITHTKYGFIGGSPDLITLDGILVEMKCPYRRNEKRINNLKRYVIPSQYMAQVQLLLEITGLEVAHYVEYYLPDKTNNEEIYIVEINRNKNWFIDNFSKMESWNNRLIDFISVKNNVLIQYIINLYRYKKCRRISYLLCAYFYKIKYLRLMEKTKECKENVKKRKISDCDQNNTNNYVSFSF